jgi:hypothetical protein
LWLRVRDDARMKIRGSGHRVLRFAVTGALLGGGAASCDGDPPDNVDVRKVEEPPEDRPTNNVVHVEDPKPDNVNVRKQPDPPEDPPIKVNPGPEEHGGDAGSPDDTKDKAPEDVHVNTEKVEEPEAEPQKRVNPGPVEEPVDLDPPARVNTAREPDPKSK